jgi:hypothetical protein
MAFSGIHISLQTSLHIRRDSHGGENTEGPVLAQLKDIHCAEKMTFSHASQDSQGGRDA